MTGIVSDWVWAKRVGAVPACSNYRWCGMATSLLKFNIIYRWRKMTAPISDLRRVHKNYVVVVVVIRMININIILFNQKA